MCGNGLMYKKWELHHTPQYPGLQHFVLRWQNWSCYLNIWVSSRCDVKKSLRILMHKLNFSISYTKCVRFNSIALSFVCNEITIKPSSFLRCVLTRAEQVSFDVRACRVDLFCANKSCLDHSTHDYHSKMCEMIAATGHGVPLSYKRWHFQHCAAFTAPISMTVWEKERQKRQPCLDHKWWLTKNMTTPWACIKHMHRCSFGA